LPVSLIDRREAGKSFFRCSESFYDFICTVESVYLANLTLKMMLAHAGGSLCSAINNGVVNNKEIREKFAELAETATIDDEEQRNDIFAFLMERYVNMRGRWFVKIMKGQQGVKNILDNAATRKKVASAVACSQAAAAARKDTDDSAARDATTSSTEQQLYAGVENTLMDAVEDDEIIDCSNEHRVETEEAKEME